VITTGKGQLIIDFVAFHNITTGKGQHNIARFYRYTNLFTFIKVYQIQVYIGITKKGEGVGE